MQWQLEGLGLSQQLLEHEGKQGKTGVDAVGRMTFRLQTDF